VLELVDRIILRFIDVNRKRSSRFSDRKRGYSLTGKTANLHFVILGSSPNISIFITSSSISHRNHVPNFRSNHKANRHGLGLQIRSNG
jgi:hypothetical protein